MKNKAIIRQLIAKSCGTENYCKITQRAWTESDLAKSVGMGLNDTYRAICLLQECGEIRIENGTIYKTDKFQGE